MRRKSNRALPIIIFTAMLVVLTYSAVSVVNASSLGKRSKAWKRIETSVDAEEDTYPYNSDTAQITSVSMDILYGTSRDLVTFFGEVPYVETYDGDKRASGWSGYYAIEGTSIQTGNKNPPFNSISAADYWGIDEWTGVKVGDVDLGALPGKTAVTINEMDAVNSQGVRSLRLYALANSESNGGWFFGMDYSIGRGYIFYSFQQMMCKLGNTIIKLLITVKNISVDTFLDVLHLGDLSNFVTHNFIGFKVAGGTFWLSPFTGFCIIMGMFAIASYGISQATGKSKKVSMPTLLARIGLGVILIMVCVLGKVTDLGSTAANLVSGFLYTIDGSLSASNNSAFTIMIDDPENQNRIIQMQEMSIVNRTFMNVQIATQFGVDDITDLDVNNLGDTDFKIAHEVLYGLGSSKFEEDFGGNLGYYFWFADSGASYKTVHNAQYPQLSTAAPEAKMSSMISYMQRLHTIARAKTDTKTMNKLEKMTIAFADPSPWAGGIKLFLLSIILILLALCLWKYGLLVLRSKLEMFFALMGLAVAGPLIVTNKDKLVKTGTNILGMILVSFVNITVYSIFFDLVLYFTAAVLSGGSFLSMILTILLLILLLIFNPALQAKLNQILESTGRKYAPGYMRARQTAITAARKRSDKIEKWYGNREHTVGYDKNGKAIKKKNEGNFLHRAMRQTNNAMFATQGEKESVWKIHKKGKDAYHDNAARAEKSLSEARDQEVKEVEKKIKETADINLEGYKKEVEAAESKKYSEKKNENGTVSLTFNAENLNADEQELLSQINEGKVQLQDLHNDPRYRMLCEKVARGEELTEEENKDLQNMQKLLELRYGQVATTEARLKELIKSDELMAVIGKIVDRDLYEHIKTLPLDQQQKYLTQITKAQAQDQHKEEYSRVLHRAVDQSAKETEVDVQSARLGTKRKAFNDTAIKLQAASTYKLAQLEAGMLVSDAATIEKEIDPLVSQIKSSYTHAKTNAVIEANRQRLKAMEGEDSVYKNTAERAEDYDKTVDSIKEQKTIIKGERKGGKAMKNEMKDEGHSASLSEQLRYGVERHMDTKFDTMQIGTMADRYAQQFGIATVATAAPIVTAVPTPTSTPATASSGTTTQPSGTSKSRPQPSKPSTETETSTVNMASAGYATQPQKPQPQPQKAPEQPQKPLGNDLANQVNGSRKMESTSDAAAFLERVSNTPQPTQATPVAPKPTAPVAPVPAPAPQPQSAPARDTRAPRATENTRSAPVPEPQKSAPVPAPASGTTTNVGISPDALRESVRKIQEEERSRGFADRAKETRVPQEFTQKPKEQPSSNSGMNIGEAIAQQQAGRHVMPSTSGTYTVVSGESRSVPATQSNSSSPFVQPKTETRAPISNGEERKPNITINKTTESAPAKETTSNTPSAPKPEKPKKEPKKQPKKQDSLGTSAKKARDSEMNASGTSKKEQDALKRDQEIDDRLNS